MKEIISNTPYDDVYRTMIVEDDELVLPLLNEGDIEAASLGLEPRTS